MHTGKAIRLMTAIAAAALMALPVLNIGAQSSSTVTIKKGDKITIGWAGDLSGKNVPLADSQGILYASQIAVNRTNAAGGIQGFQLAIEQQDDQCVGDIATTVANKFASEPYIVAIVGHVCSGATIPASDVYEKARIPLVSASATAHKVTNRGLDVVNRTAFTDDFQAVADADYFAKTLKAKSIVVLDDNSSYGQGLANSLAADYTAMGGTVADHESIDPAAKDYTPILTKFVATPPDVIFFGGYYGPAALLTQQMHQLGMTKTAFFSDDGVYGADYIKLTGNDGETQYASSTGTATLTDAQKKLNADFQAEFEKTYSVKFDDYAPYQGTGYDATQMIINAITAVAKTDSSGNLTIDREALIKAVRGTKGYVGLTGTLSCDSKGECGAGTVSINQVTKGNWAVVKSYSSDDAKALLAALPAAAATAAPTAAATKSS